MKGKEFLKKIKEVEDNMFILKDSLKNGDNGKLLLSKSQQESMLACMQHYHHMLLDADVLPWEKGEYVSTSDSKESLTVGDIVANENFDANLNVRIFEGIWNEDGRLLWDKDSDIPTYLLNKKISYVTINCGYLIIEVK